MHPTIANMGDERFLGVAATGVKDSYVFASRDLDLK